MHGLKHPKSAFLYVVMKKFSKIIVKIQAIENLHNQIIVRVRTCGLSRDRRRCWQHDITFEIKSSVLQNWMNCEFAIMHEMIILLTANHDTCCQCNHLPSVKDYAGSSILLADCCSWMQQMLLAVLRSVSTAVFSAFSTSIAMLPAKQWSYLTRSVNFVALLMAISRPHCFPSTLTVVHIRFIGQNVSVRYFIVT